jgi:NADH dehydrogenase
VVDHRGNRNLIRASVDAGVGHFVLLSVLGAGPHHPMSLHRAKYAAEQSLRTSAMAWSILRPASYIETWTEIVGEKLGSDGTALVFGRAQNPINFVSIQDVATLAVRALTDPMMRGVTIDVPGTADLTMEQLACHLGAREIRHIPRGALRVLSTILPPWAPAFARQAHAALVMDTTDMTADASALRARFPDITWHPPSEIAEQYPAAHGTAGES